MLYVYCISMKLGQQINAHIYFNEVLQGTLVFPYSGQGHSNEIWNRPTTEDRYCMILFIWGT